MPNQKIIDYIKVQLHAGFTKDKIKSDLIMNGTLPSEIELAFNSLKIGAQNINAASNTPLQNSPNPINSNPVNSAPIFTNQQPKSSFSKTILIIVGVLILVGAISASAYIYLNKKPMGATSLTWSTKAPTTLNWANAIAYCSNLEEGGYSDWRLPTIDELMVASAEQFTNKHPGGFQDNTSYWSGSENYVDGAWFGGGFYGLPVNGFNDRYYLYEVRCVHGGTNVPEVSVPVPLVWSTTLGKMNWTDAGVACATLKEGSGGWRLPTTHELRAALIDQKNGQPMDFQVATDYWSSSEDDKYSAWSNDILNGNPNINSNADLKSNQDSVRCVSAINNATAPIVKDKLKIVATSTKVIPNVSSDPTSLVWSSIVPVELCWDANQGCSEGHGLLNGRGAVEYCYTLVEGGYSDWRVPTEAELESAFVIQFVHGGPGDFQVNTNYLSGSDVSTGWNAGDVNGGLYNNLDFMPTSHLVRCVR